MFPAASFACWMATGASMGSGWPFVFQGCGVPDHKDFRVAGDLQGWLYHHPPLATFLDRKPAHQAGCLDPGCPNQGAGHNDFPSFEPDMPAVIFLDRFPKLHLDMFLVKLLGGVTPQFYGETGQKPVHHLQQDHAAYPCSPSRGNLS